MRSLRFRRFIAVHAEVSFLSVARALTLRLTASHSRLVDGVSSDHGPEAAHRLTDHEYQNRTKVYALRG